MESRSHRWRPDRIHPVALDRWTGPQTTAKDQPGDGTGALLPSQTPSDPQVTACALRSNERDDFLVFRVRGALHHLPGRRRKNAADQGYYPNPSEAAVSRSYHERFEVLGDLHPSDDSPTSFHSQISSVFRHPGKKDLYIALADRWLPRYLDHGQRVHDAVAAHFAPGRDGDEPMDEFAHVDTSIADYVRLPLRLDGDRPVIDWRDEWSPDEYEDA